MTQRINPIGISAHLGVLSSTDLNRQLDLMQAAGINWVRFDMYWGSIEKTQGVWNFSVYDAIVSGIRARGMQPLAILNFIYAPPWYRGTDPYNKAPLPQDYAMFAQTVASHYQGQILLYEIGNEQNSNGNWYPQASASAYTALLQAAYPAIKTADPNAKVVSGGLGNQAPVTFLTQMYQSGAQGYMDYIGFHPYSWPNGPDYTGLSTPFSVCVNIKSVMTNNGDGNKQIMATEVGWPTYSGGVTEANQAAYIGRVYQKIMHENYQYVSLACVYDFLDDGIDPTNPEHHFGLLRTDYTQKPAYSTMQAERADYNANFTPINP